MKFACQLDVINKLGNLIESNVTVKDMLEVEWPSSDYLYAEEQAEQGCTGRLLGQNLQMDRWRARRIWGHQMRTSRAIRVADPSGSFPETIEDNDIRTTTN